MKAVVFIISIFAFGNFALADSQPSDTADSQIETSREVNMGRRSFSSESFRCPKDRTRTYRSGKYLIYERCAENGRWVSAGTRRINIHY